MAVIDTSGSIDDERLIEKIASSKKYNSSSAANIIQKMKLNIPKIQRHRIDNSVFDNSWDVYPQDLPSEKYFLDHGITKILVISDKLAVDLKRIFKEYPKKEIKVYFTDGYEKPKRININRKLFFKSKTRDD